MRIASVERAERLLLDLLIELGRDRLGGDHDLLLADGGLQLLDGGDDLLDRGVRGFERADDLRFGHFLGAGLDHHDAVARAGDDQVERALLALGVRRVDDVLVVDQADAHAGDGLLERDLRDGQRRRGAGDRQHVGVVLGVGRHQQRDDLRLEAPAGGEERPDRSIDQPAGEHFLFRGLALALEEAAGDASRRVGVFAVVDRQREEVDVARAGGARSGHEHHGVAGSDDHRAVGLLGELAGFEGHRAGSDLDLAPLQINVVHVT